MPSRTLERESYRPMPWRNGRGSTLEIAREPTAGEEFAWRLSLADIERNSEFSAYPGYSRALVLVAGNNLRLRFRGHGHYSLNPAKRGTRFEGDWQTHCAVPKGPCTDLSLIVRKGPAGRKVSVVREPTVLRLESTRRVVISEGLCGALFVLEGSLAVAESDRARARTLRKHQTLLLSPGSRKLLTLNRRGQSTAEIVILRWRPGGRPASR